MFKNRIDAAEQLAEILKKESFADPMVVALPRGGVPLGRVVADALNAPLEIVVPRKIGAPENEEYAIGALAEEGEVIWNRSERSRVDDAWAEKAVEHERKEAQRRRKVYGRGRPRASFTGKDVILVDDGMATGMTMEAAVSTVKKDYPNSITVAVPVAPKDTIDRFRSLVDTVICPQTPLFFGAVAAHYDEFDQTSDEEVVQLLNPQYRANAQTGLRA